MAPWTLVPLRQAPQHLAQLALWLHGERLRTGQAGNLADSQARLARELDSRAPFPHTLLALAGPELLGAASIIRLTGHLAEADALWLANVYVAPHWRGQGLGRALCRAQLAYAAAQGAPRLLLFTHDAAPFYRRQGWQPLRRATLHQRAITIMERALCG